MNPLSKTIESILFATAEEYTIAALAQLTQASKEEVGDALVELSQSLESHALMVVRQGDTVTLATRPEHASILETIRKEELQKDLSRASAETLAVIVYHPGATKAEIELIRGVNASYSLRALQIRGLIETHPSNSSGQEGKRGVTYHPTLALLEHYGVSDLSQLPQYGETVEKISKLLTPEEV